MVLRAVRKWFVGILNNFVARLGSWRRLPLITTMHFLAAPWDCDMQSVHTLQTFDPTVPHSACGNTNLPKPKIKFQKPIIARNFEKVQHPKNLLRLRQGLFVLAATHTNHGATGVAWREALVC